MSFWSAAGSVIGGLLGGGDKPYTPSQNIRSAAKGARRAGAEFGFNPLTLLGLGGTYPGSAGNPGLSQAFADAAMMLGETFAADTSAQKLNQYQQQADYLRRKVDRLTLRPPKPGVYGDTEGTTGQEFAAESTDVGGASAPYEMGTDEYNWLDPDIKSESDDASKVPRKPLFMGGMPLHPTSGTSDSEAIGSRYGEDFGSPAWFSGWGSFIYDSATQAGRGYRMGADKLGLTDPKTHYGKNAADFLFPSFEEEDAAYKEYLAERKRKKPKAKPRKQFYTHPQTGYTGLMQ